METPPTLYFIDKAISVVLRGSVSPEANTLDSSIPNELDKETISNTVLPYLNLSLLSGEFIHSEYISKLETLKKETSENIDLLIDKAIFFSKYIQKRLEESKQEGISFGYVDEISKCFTLKEIDKIISKDGSSLPKFDPELFNANLLLAELDFSLECSEKYLRTILRLYHSFFERFKTVKQQGIPENNNIAKILRYKCEFLIYKVMIRLEEEEIYDESLPNSILKKGDIEQRLSPFLCFFEKVNKIYNTSDGSMLLSNEDYLCLREEKIAICDAHRISKKAYKDQELDGREVIEKIRSKIQINPTNDIGINKFNAFAKHNIDFLLNKNLQKIAYKKLENFTEKFGTDTVKRIEEGDLKIIKSLQGEIFDGYLKTSNDLDNASSEIFINDYYHHYLFADASAELIEFCFLRAHKDSRVYEVAQSLLDNLSSLEVVEKIGKSLTWIRAKSYLPIYSPYDECLTSPIDLFNEKCPLFLDSSYVLPINITRQRERYENLKQRLFYLKLLSNRFKFLTGELDEFKEIIKQEKQKILQEKKSELDENFNKKIVDIDKKIDKQIREQSISGVQTLGLFASVISLVLGFFNILPKIENMWLIVFFMIAFSGCLVFFVHALGRVIDFQNLEKSKTIKSYYLYTLIALGFFMLLFTFSKEARKASYLFPRVIYSDTLIIKEITKDTILDNGMDQYKIGENKLQNKNSCCTKH